jgi:hypothetical protein
MNPAKTKGGDKTHPALPALGFSFAQRIKAA